MILPTIYVGRNRNRKESEFSFTDSDSKPWIPITLLDSRQSVLLCARPPIAIWAPSNCLRSSQNHTLPSHSVEETDSHPNTSFLKLIITHSSKLFIPLNQLPEKSIYTCIHLSKPVILRDVLFVCFISLSITQFICCCLYLCDCPCIYSGALR